MMQALAVRPSASQNQAFGRRLSPIGYSPVPTVDGNYQGADYFSLP